MLVTNNVRGVAVRNLSIWLHVAKAQSKSNGITCPAYLLKELYGLLEIEKSETRMTASVLIQDPNT